MIEVNAAVASDVSVLGDDPLGNGWILKLRPTNPDELAQLLDHEAYQKKVAEEAH